MLKRNTNLFIKLLLIVLFVVLIVAVSVLASAEQDSTTSSANSSRKVLIDTPKLYPELDYAIYYDPEQTKDLLSEIRSAIKKLAKIEKSKYTCEAVVAMLNESARLEEIESKVSSDLEHYIAWESEYYYATKVWEYFMQRGYGEVVTSAIIGNMMIETSGGTLALNPTIYSPSGNYYGLCQWSLKYCPDAKDLPFEHQLDYLLGGMPWEFNTFGKNYRIGFKYYDFLVMKDPSEAALAFAKSYERCGPASYEMRQEAALKAYEYFDLNS